MKTKIRFCEIYVILSCDAQCDKAYGINWYGKKTIPAPINTGICEGGQCKPTNKKHNKWCARECERSNIERKDKNIMPMYRIFTEWSGYSRGNAIYEIKAKNEKEARELRWKGDLIKRTVVRDDTESEITKVEKMEIRKYLKDGDAAFCNGCFLIWSGGEWRVGGIEDDTYCDGELVDTDHNGKPYIMVKERDGNSE